MAVMEDGHVVDGWCGCFEMVVVRGWCRLLFK